MVLEDLRINSAVGVWPSEHFARNHHLNGCLKLGSPPLDKANQHAALWFYDRLAFHVFFVFSVPHLTMLKTPAAFLFYFSPIIRFRLCLGVYLTVYFAIHLVGKVFFVRSFWSFFWKVTQGATVRFGALLHSFFFGCLFIPAPDHVKNPGSFSGLCFQTVRFRLWRTISEHLLKAKRRATVSWAK